MIHADHIMTLFSGDNITEAGTNFYGGG